MAKKASKKESRKSVPQSKSTKGSVKKGNSKGVSIKKGIGPKGMKKVASKPATRIALFDEPNCIISFLQEIDGFYWYELSCCNEPHLSVFVSRTEYNPVPCHAGPCVEVPDDTIGMEQVKPLFEFGISPIRFRGQFHVVGPCKGQPTGVVRREITIEVTACHAEIDPGNLVGQKFLLREIRGTFAYYWLAQIIADHVKCDSKATVTYRLRSFVGEQIERLHVLDLVLDDGLRPAERVNTVFVVGTPQE